MQDVAAVTVKMGVRKFRDELADAVNLAHHGTPVVLTYHNRPWCVLLSVEQAARFLAGTTKETNDDSGD